MGRLFRLNELIIIDTHLVPWVILLNCIFSYVMKVEDLAVEAILYKFSKIYL